MKKILFIGPPGSGKGTQAEILTKKGFLHISSGDLIRKSTDPRIIKYREVDYKKGKLLTDKLLYELVEKNIPKGDKKYVLDGVVRTISQAKHAKKMNWIDGVIYFFLDEKKATERILKRNEGRSDDNLISIKERFDEYRKKTEPVLEYLKKNFEFYEIDASKTIEEVNKNVEKILK